MKAVYAEGTAFFVPLLGGGFARGVVARARARRRGLFGYFFGPRLPSMDGADFRDFQPAHAIYRTRFSDLGLTTGAWKVIGTLPGWDRAQWPMPDFVRVQPAIEKFGVEERYFLVRYCDNDPLKREMEYQIPDKGGLDKDGLAGSGYVEIRLSRLLPPET